MTLTEKYWKPFDERLSLPANSHKKELLENRYAHFSDDLADEFNRQTEDEKKADDKLIKVIVRLREDCVSFDRKIQNKKEWSGSGHPFFEDDEVITPEKVKIYKNLVKQDYKKVMKLMDERGWS